jgi:hypothetical protein
MFPRAEAWIYRHVRTMVSASTIVVLLLVIFLSLRETGRVDALIVDGKTMAQEVEGMAVSPLLSYQGRLVNPTTGAPMADGSYTFTFRIYNVESGGAELWTELKDITVTNGLFSHQLGSVTPLPSSIFTGQNLWLGIKVNTDAEATPRQRLVPVAYAMYSDNADRLDGQDSAFFRNATNVNAGTLAETRVDAAITRDSEVISLVTAADGTGSTLDADLLDGQDSAFFRNATNLNAGTLAEARVDAAITRDSEVMGLVTAADGTGSTLDADLLDGLNSSAFAPVNHNHDPLYVNTVGPDSISAKIANAAVFTVTQTDSGNGIYASTVSVDPGEAAIRGVAGATGPAGNGVSGVWGTSASGRGVTGSSNTDDGVFGFSSSGTGVDGQSLTGIGVRAFSSSGTALQVDGPAVFNGTISNPFVPIALGFINADGTKGVGSANVSSVWNAANLRYEITISGQSYFFNTFVTNVTPICAAHTARTSSVSGKLLIFVYNSAGTVVQCDFQFVTYKP